MNNFTKTEALPKTGHVNEVCKEWLVREDSAFAYKLQSQEINDFYKGNRQRNAVVREDFPTALNEQIKEKEEAEKQVEMYRRRLLEQEAHDKRVAKEIADKLERDLQEQRQREMLESEEVAQQMQELYVNLPPPSRMRGAHQPPPRPAKASILQQNTNEPSISNGRYFGSGSGSNSQHTSHHHHHHHHHHQQSQQQQLAQSPLSTPQQPMSSNLQQYEQQQQQLSPTSIMLQQKHFSQTDCYVGLTVQKTPSSPTAASGASTSVDSSLTPPTSATRQQSRSHSNALSNSSASAHGGHLLKLSPEKYDQMVGNDGSGRGMAAERHMQEHADDIELYVDPCDYASLKEIGLPMEEIKEMSKKIKQEQKDELLARRLQQMEAHDGLTQEERDRLLAIEAQDKELAKMLQDRERAKAKRAKEKARLRKHQLKDNTTLCSSNGSSSNGLHCGPLLPLPQDCLSFGKHSSTHAAASPTAANSSTQPNVQGHSQEEVDIIDLEAYSNPIDVLNNQQQRQHQNGTLTNGSLTREGGRRIHHSQQQNSGNGSTNGMLNRVDDDIYTLPVDSCRPGQRPASLNISPTAEVHLMQNNSMTRSENYSIDSHDSLSRQQDLATRMNYSQSSTFDKSSSPTPPYMPIQGTRRSNSSDDRKKKSKDKCTHQ